MDDTFELQGAEFRGQILGGGGSANTFRVAQEQDAHIVRIGGAHARVIHLENIQRIEGRRGMAEEVTLDCDVRYVGFAIRRIGSDLATFGSDRIGF